MPLALGKCRALRGRVSGTPRHAVITGKAAFLHWEALFLSIPQAQSVTSAAQKLGAGQFLEDHVIQPPNRGLNLPSLSQGIWQLGLP